MGENRGVYALGAQILEPTATEGRRQPRRAGGCCLFDVEVWERRVSLIDGVQVDIGSNVASAWNGW